VARRESRLFCGTVTGAHASANLSSLIESARAKTDRYRYLANLFKARPLASSAEGYETLLPMNIKLHDAA